MRLPVILPLKIQNEATEMGRLTPACCLGYQSQNIIAGCQPTLQWKYRLCQFQRLGMGEPYFPQEYSTNKWKLAADAYEEGTQNCYRRQGHGLYNFKEESLTNLRMGWMYSMNVRQAVTERFNRELVWGCGQIIYP